MHTHLDFLDTDIFKTSWRHVLKTSCRHVLKTSWRHVFKTSSARLQRNNFSSSKMSSRRLEDVFKASCKMSSRRIQDVLEDEKLLRWRRLENVLKTCLEDVFKMSSRPTNVCWAILEVRIGSKSTWVLTCFQTDLVDRVNSKRKLKRNLGTSSWWHHIVSKTCFEGPLGDVLKTSWRRRKLTS